MGKSASGKDTVYEKLLHDSRLSLRPIVLYTTRPVRTGEKDGITYHFRDNAFFREHENDKRMIESRVYQTVAGPWYYFTMDDGQIDLQQNDYLMIGTLVSYLKMVEYFGKEKMLPIYLEIDDAERLQRALDREKRQSVPRFDEVCRRYLTDEADFSEENLMLAGIKERFCNCDLEKCLSCVAGRIMAAEVISGQWEDGVQLCGEDRE